MSDAQFNAINIAGVMIYKRSPQENASSSNTLVQDRKKA